MNISAAEWGWLFAATLVGVWLRVAHLDRLAVEHFDEAVYASNVLFGPETGYEFPGRPFFAPPLLPALIEALHVIWGGSRVPAWLPMAPSLFFGMATIPSLWWIARRWFSPDAAVAAAWLIALCEYHVVYSRTALTDVPLTFFVLWAVYFFSRALQRDSKWYAALAGALTGAAWWTKYNGWLPLAIAVCASGLWLLLSHAGGRIWLRKAAVCGIAGSFAVILWMPVLWDCESVGGYAAVAENHRGYLDGWSRWLPNARRQLEVHGGTYAGWLTAWAICGPTVCLGVINSRFVRRLLGQTMGDGGFQWDVQRLVWLMVNAAIVAVRPASWLPIVVGAGTICTVLALRRAVRERSEPFGLNVSLVLVWVISLLVATPLYRPYPRLLLPLIVGGLLAGSIFWRRGWAPFTGPQSSRASRLAAGTMLASATALSLFHGSTAWEDRSWYRTAAHQVAAALQDASPAVVFVSGEPALVYWLHQSGVTSANAATLDIQSLPEVPTYLAIGPVTLARSSFETEWQSIAGQFEPVAEIRVSKPALSTIVRLDQDADVSRRLQDTTPSVRLYRRR